MVDNPEEDDVDIFVSPRRFGGRTPGAKETFKKVREEEEARKDAGKGGTDSTNRFEGVKYNFDPDRLGKFGRKTHYEGELPALIMPK